MIRIALLDDYQNVAMDFAHWERLPEGASVETFSEHLGSDEAVATALAPFHIVMAMRERTALPGAVLRRLPELRMIATAGARNSAIDMDVATELGIVVSGTGGDLASTMELTWGLIFSLMRHLPREAANMREGGWVETMGTALGGRTLGLIGLGHIGGMMVPVAKAFKMRVIAWSQHLTEEHAAQVGAQRVDRDTLLRESDIVSVHLKLGERTTGLLGHKELRLMKSSAVLINTSRGPIVDEGALVDALQSNAIGGAGLDVFDVEPLPADHPLRKLDNVVLTPHLGYATDAVYHTFYGESLENMLAYLEGNPKRVVNEDVLGKLRPPPGA